MAHIFTAIPRSQTTGRTVEQLIKELISAKTLSIGDKLPPERQLADRLGVSRSTLRGALQSLTEQGILVGRHGSAWTVEPSPTTVADNLALYLNLEAVTFDQLFAARQAIEPAIAAAAAENRSSMQLVALDDCIEAMAFETGGEAFRRADEEFHALLATASGNVVFSLLLSATLSLLRETRVWIARDTTIIADSRDEHLAVLDAVRRQDPEAAKAAMLSHIARFTSSARQALDTINDNDRRQDTDTNMTHYEENA